jgi:predicted dehydrogenase
MSEPHRLLVLGTGNIAEKHARLFGAQPDCVLVAAVDRDVDRARAYAARFGVPHVFDDLDAAIRWGGFDAAINATPDALHKPTTLQLLAAGKHVLCEKPLALTGADALEMTEAAEHSGLVNMVNFTYRNSNALQTARQLVDAGALGSVRHIEASYLQSWLTAATWGDWRTEERWLWRLSTAHG